MIALVGSVLGASLLGSPHCAGMCGGFVVFYAGQESGSRRPWPHLAYNGGRLLSYVALGAVAGALGAGVDRIGAAAGIGRAAAILAGLLMVTWGGLTLLRALGVRLPTTIAPAALHRAVAGAMRALHARPPEVRALALGLLSTLLPCGWLYAFATTAAATGAAATGALVMAAFWLGTLPVMAGFGLLAQRAVGPLRRRLPAFTAAALVVVGLLTMAGRIPTTFAARERAPRHGAHGAPASASAMGAAAARGATGTASDRGAVGSAAADSLASIAGGTADCCAAPAARAAAALAPAESAAAASRR